MIVAMAGLPGTGKSAIARRLAQTLPAIVLDKDVIRAALFPPSEIEYSTRQDDFCMHVMMQVVEYVLGVNPDRHIILDGRTFSRRYQLAGWRGLATELRVPLWVIECTCSDETVKQRLDRDRAEGRHLAANRTYEMYLSVKARAEPVEGPKLVTSTEDDLARCVQRVLQYVMPGD